MQHKNAPQLTSPLVTAQQAAEYIQINERTLANWRFLGRGPRYIRVGRKPFYRLTDLDVWLNEHVYAHCAAERAERTSPAA